jgi:hypothetical protein
LLFLKSTLLYNIEQFWVNIGVIRHVCVEKRIISTYKEMDGDNLYMENSSTSKVLGVRKVMLTMTSGKPLTLNNILHVADIRKNLVSDLLLSKNSYKMVFENDKFILSKSDMFIEKGYHCDSLFKMNVMTIVIIDENNNKIVSSSYLFESCDVWHGMLGHMNYNYIQRLINHELLPNMIFWKNHKCEIYVESKFTKLYFQIIKKKW